MTKVRLAAVAALVTTLVCACTGAGTLPSPAITGARFGTDAKGTVNLCVRAATQADGCGPLRCLLFVLRPLIVPGVATTVLYAFLMSWTEFLGALTFLTNTNLFTLPVALLNIQTGTYGALNYGYLIAGSVIAMIPCVILFIGLQRFYIRGLASGAVKG